MKNRKRLITVTRQDLTSGYQTVQTAHAVADYALKKPIRFLMWRLTGKYLISLAVKDKQSLEELMEVLDNQRIGYVSFYEPDINEITAIAISPSRQANLITTSLPLANKVIRGVSKFN